MCFITVNVVLHFPGFFVFVKRSNIISNKTGGQEFSWNFVTAVSKERSTELPLPQYPKSLVQKNAYKGQCTFLQLPSVQHETALRS